MELWGKSGRFPAAPTQDVPLRTSVHTPNWSLPTSELVPDHQNWFLPTPELVPAHAHLVVCTEVLVFLHHLQLVASPHQNRPHPSARQVGVQLRRKDVDPP